MNENLLRILKWVGAAVIAILAVAAIRKGYLASQPTVADLEIGVDLRNAAVRAAAKHEIPDTDVAVVFRTAEGKAMFADIAVNEQFERLAAIERQHLQGNRPSTRALRA